MAESTVDPIVLSLDIEDPDLARRLAGALGPAVGIRLARPGERADAVISASHSSSETDAGLTPREREVLLLLAEGISNKAIARRLGITVNTVKFHVASLLDKLEASGRTDAVTHAARMGVIHL